ncbi:MAG: hypothetical protein HKP45_02785 [Winogradskyella sp.]|nr:hypothetical protein [Winogradskyella sp.]
MKKLVLKIFAIHILFVLVVACTIEEDNPADCQSTYEYLQDLKILIEDQAAESICTEGFECRSIAFGSKPCGGPWSYLVYSTSIDTLDLVDRVNDYNELEMTFNINCGAISDCAVVNPPTSLMCENNQCIAIY